MAGALFHHLVPASLYGRQTAFPALSRITEEFRECQGAGEATLAIERSKAVLYSLLRRRFEEPLAQALSLKVLNVCLAGYHFHARSTVVSSRPVGIVADTSNVCRLSCPGCVHSARSEALKRFDWPKGTLTGHRYSELLRLYGPYAIEVYFCNYGEPLLNLDTPKLIRMAKTYLMGAMLSTSLSVQRFDADAYVESGLDFMVLSIDGATQPVYERFRRNGNLELVFANLRRLVEAKRKLRKRTPVLSWNFLAFEHNAHEIPLASRMAKRLGVNQFRVVTPFDVTWDDPEIRPAAIQPLVRRLDWLSTTNMPENWNPFPDQVEAGAIARAFERPWTPGQGSDEPTKPGHTCQWLYKNIVMDATGRVLPCCGAPKPDMDLVFSTIDGGDADPFNSEKHRRARAWFRNPAPDPAAPCCARCVWDQTTVNIGGPEIRRYFRAADAAFFDRQSLRMLAAT